MGHFSMEKSLNPGSALSGNQQTPSGNALTSLNGFLVKGTANDRQILQGPQSTFQP